MIGVAKLPSLTKEMWTFIASLQAANRFPELQ